MCFEFQDSNFEFKAYKGPKAAQNRDKWLLFGSVWLQICALWGQISALWAQYFYLKTLERILKMRFSTHEYTNAGMRLIVWPGTVEFIVNGEDDVFNNQKT